MNNKLVRPVLLASALFFASTASSQTLTLAGGKTIRSNTTEHDAYRLEMNFPWRAEFWNNESWGMSLRHALSIITFRDKNNVNAISWTPNLTLTPRDHSGLYPFLQIGFGFAYLSDDKFESDGSPRYRFNGDLVYDDGTSDMGSHGQFESSIALGLVKNSFSVRANVYHYSNANFTSDNGGMDVAEFGVSYRF